MEAAGLPSIDGWYAWAVKDTDVSLSALRRDLLAEADGGSPTSSEPAREPTEVESRQEMLRAAVESAETGDPKTLSVRTLLGYWDAQMRGRRVVDRMLADLDNYSLMTRPDFQTVSLSSEVEMVLQPKLTDETAPDADESTVDGNELDVGLTLGNLPSALEGVTSVNPNDSIEKAMTLMRLSDFSQLPVMTSSRDIRGVVTWKSIAKALAHEPSAKLTDAIEPAPVHAFDQDLVDVLSVLYDHDFMFVRDDKREISGIVTTADVVRLYGETATPFFIIGEIDHLLRNAISDEWTPEQVATICDPDDARTITSHDDLTFGDYQRMLEAPDRFDAMGWPLDRATFINRLNEVREIRNGIAHFDPDPLDAATVASLKHFLKLLRDLRKWDTR